MHFWSESGSVPGTLGVCVSQAPATTCMLNLSSITVSHMQGLHLEEVDAEGVLEHGRKRYIILPGRITTVLCDPDLGCIVAAVHVGQQLAKAPGHRHQPL